MYKDNTQSEHLTAYIIYQLRNRIDNFVTFSVLSRHYILYETMKHENTETSRLLKMSVYLKF